MATAAFLSDFSLPTSVRFGRLLLLPGVRAHVRIRVRESHAERRQRDDDREKFERQRDIRFVAGDAPPSREGWVQHVREDPVTGAPVGGWVPKLYGPQSEPPGGGPLPLEGIEWVGEVMMRSHPELPPFPILVGNRHVPSLADSHLILALDYECVRENAASLCPFDDVPGQCFWQSQLDFFRGTAHPEGRTAEPIPGTPRADRQFVEECMAEVARDLREHGLLGGDAVALRASEATQPIASNTTAVPTGTHPTRPHAPDSCGDDRTRAAPDGPFGNDGFRFRGQEVRFGQAKLPYRLMVAVWDAQAGRPRERVELRAVAKALAEHKPRLRKGSKHRPKSHSAGSVRKLAAKTSAALLESKIPMKVKGLSDCVTTEVLDV